MYYSLLWTEPSARQRFITRLNLVQTLHTTLDDVQEPQVAERKIHWWHEELQRMIEGEARHPATQACLDDFSAAELGSAALPVETPENSTEPALNHLLSILSSVSTSRFAPATDDTETNTRLTQCYRAQLALLSHALSNSADDLIAHTHSDIAALALAKQAQLIRLPYLLHRGHPVFSDETYKRYGIRPTDLAKDIPVANDNDDIGQISASTFSGIPVSVQSPGKRKLLTAAITDASVTLQSAVSDQKTCQRYRREPLLPIWRFLILREKQAALWMKSQPDILRERSTLTPLKKFLIAWRHRR